jgi:hypothetical protein
VSSGTTPAPIHCPRRHESQGLARAKGKDRSISAVCSHGPGINAGRIFWAGMPGPDEHLPETADEWLVHHRRLGALNQVRQFQADRPYVCVLSQYVFSNP